MTHLFDAWTLREVRFRNRIGIPPMCMYSATEQGLPTDFHLIHLGARAVGGAGLVIAEATAVEARGRISPFDLGIWSDAHIEPFARVVRAIKEHGAVAGIQLAHAGRKAGTRRPWEGGGPLPAQEAWPVVGASAVPFTAKYAVPHALTLAEIDEVRASFVAAAVRSREAGFDVVELHAAHGYLLQSFLSPLSNRREDRYGGARENRMRFLLETVRDVRAVWPASLPLFVRISATEWVDGGWNVDDSVALAVELGKLGVDLIDCSSGGNVSDAKVPSTPGYQAEFARRIKRETGIPTAAVGLITEAEHAEQLIANTEADLILIGRASLRDPYWPHAAARELLGRASEVPNQYARAF